jgi:hypothetical protein
MWKNQLKADPLPWLLEADSPGARYLAMKDLLDLPRDDPGLVEARQAAYEEGPIAAILAEMDPDGYWAEPGAGYLPKYRSTVWSLLMLAQLGAAASEDERIGQGCAYLLENSLAPGGQFSASGAPSGTADCLQGEMCWALVALGYEDPRLNAAFEWMARTVTGEGIAPVSDRQAQVRYYAGKCGPLFACGSNNKLPCAWGAAKVMLALGQWPAEHRTPLIEDAILQGVDFLFSSDPVEARYPTGYSDRPSGNWWKFGFPVFYVTDLLQIVEALVRLGFGHDPRLANTLELVREKQDEFGRWALEYDYSGKTWVDFGPKKQPNKWVTLRALRVLKDLAS